MATLTMLWGACDGDENFEMLAITSLEEENREGAVELDGVRAVSEGLGHSTKLRGSWRQRRRL